MSKTKHLHLLKNHLIDPVTGFIFPALCVVCDRLLADHEKIFCNSCRDNLIPLKQEFISKLKDEIDSRKFDGLFIAYEFERTFKALIHQLKYNRFTQLAEFFASALFPLTRMKYDFIIGVPLNPIRQRERGYNQSALIAEQLGLLSGCEYSEAILIRKENTPSQTKLNRAERIENMKEAFECTSEEKVAGKRILIIDDVITTGSTVNACARICKLNGASELDVAALATPVDFFQQNLEKN